MGEWTRKEVAGWGRFPVVEANVARPERRADVIRAVTETNGSGLLAYGLGRSYGDAALLKDGRVVVTERLDRMLAFDEATGWLTAEAGVSLSDILETFVPRGWFLPVTPGTRFVTLGGALAADVHGKDHGSRGCFSNHVRAFDLVVGDGSVVTVTRESEPELFQATAGGMGLTGVILAMEVQLRRIANPFIACDTIRTESLDHFFEVSQGHDHAATVTWIDCITKGKAMGRGVYTGGDFAPADAPLPAEGVLSKAKKALDPVMEVPINAPGWALNGMTIKAFNEAVFRKEKPGKHFAYVHYESFYYPLDFMRSWNKIYGKRGFLQYQFALPPDPEHRVMRTLLDQITRTNRGFLAVIKEFGDSDNGGLSFPMPGATLAVDFPNYGEPLMKVLDRLDDIVAEAGGRIYLAKDARLSRANFRRMYPRWEQWKAVRDRWDPKHVFRSEQGMRLGLSGEK